MNPLITANSSLFLPLNQLIPHCNRLSNALSDDSINKRDKILHEQTLWNEVKKVRALKDPSIFSYLIGYYHTILFQTSKEDLIKHDDLFQYHVLIRLGDLNRYMERIDVAEYYYCNARNLFPFSGHAYNQLGLLTKPTNCYKCCYYYARAAKSSDRPMLTIAASNLRIAVSKYKCEILSYILDGATSIQDKKNELGEPAIELPKRAFDWFYIMVIAIYADNTQPIAKLFLDYLDENFSIQRSTEVHNDIKRTIIYCDQDSYIMLATLDILLDWMKLSPSGKAQCSYILAELRRIGSCIQSAIVSYKSNLNSSEMSLGSESSTNLHSDKSSTTNVTISTTKDSRLTLNSDVSNREDANVKMPALPHDYILRGFGPLDKLYNELTFDTSIDESGMLAKRETFDVWNCGKFLGPSQLFAMLNRIKTKMDAFGALLKKKRRTRNIALESILSNINQVGE